MFKGVLPAHDEKNVILYPDSYSLYFKNCPINIFFFNIFCVPLNSYLFNF